MSFQKFPRIRPWLVGAIVLLGRFLMPIPASAEDKPFGLAKRVPWTNARLKGSPEPPLPYTVEKTFTKHTFKGPLYVADEPGTDRLWVIELSESPDKGYRVVRIKDDPNSAETEQMLDFPKRIVYSICFHPKFATNGYVYIFANLPKTAEDRYNQVLRYTVSRDAAGKLDPKSEQLVIEWKSGGHDGGDMVFGLDGMFYITSGDGTSDSDLWNSGQTLDDLLGGVLRIDVDRKEGKNNYSVPDDNPFVKLPGAKPEIWAYGLRNPWRMGIDKKTGHIWVGNNGQDLWETAHLIGKGENYGWSVYEGGHPFYLERRRGPTPIVAPTIEHSHADFRSLTGGVVYYGEKFPELNGTYIYGDYASGRIWGMKHDGKKVLRHEELADTSLMIAGFRVDRNGELLIVDNGGGIFRLIRAPKVENRPPFPLKLSETGLFNSTKEHKVDAGLIPYSVNAEGWAEGATAERFMAVQSDATVPFESGRGWVLPDDTALVQTLSLDREPGKPASRFRVETRVMVKQQGEWAGYSYRWNADQTDAELVPKGGEDTKFDLAGGKSLKWRFPSRSDCMMCHARAAGFVLGITGAQLNRDHNYGKVTDNQLRTLQHIGLFKGKLGKEPKDLDKMVNPRDESADVEKRARAYLHVNCAVCHVEAGGGNAQMQLAIATAREKMNIIGTRPQHDTFGISNAMLVAPGDPDRSVIVHRLSKRGPGQMPPLVVNQVDDGAVALMRRWIGGMKPEQAFVKDWKLDDLLPALGKVKGSRSAEAGRKVFRDTGCVQCHKFGAEGGSVGPDLTGLAKRVPLPEMVESIVLPSKKIAEEYAVIQIERSDGTVVSGKIEREDDRVVVLRPSAFATETIDKKDIVERKKSALSNMPAGIVNVLKEEQILDLLNYLTGEPLPPTEVKK